MRFYVQITVEIEAKNDGAARKIADELVELLDDQNHTVETNWWDVETKDEQ